MENKNAPVEKPSWAPPKLGGKLMCFLSQKWHVNLHKGFILTTYNIFVSMLHYRGVFSAAVLNPGVKEVLQELREGLECHISMQMVPEHRLIKDDKGSGRGNVSSLCLRSLRVAVTIHNSSWRPEVWFSGGQIHLWLTNYRNKNKKTLWVHSSNRKKMGKETKSTNLSHTLKGN